MVVGINPVVVKYSDEAIESEPMLHRADLEFSRKNGGSITRSFLRALDYYGWLEGCDSDFYIDSRSHMLMEGWYPCIPGWHHDDVPRTRIDKQPNYETPEYYAEHAMLLLNADLAPTEFITGVFNLPEVPIGETVYEKWHKEVDKAYAENPLKYVKEYAPNDRIVVFNSSTFHQGTTAVNSGWRFFIRATKKSKATIKNKIRKNANVYLPAPFAGW